MGAAAIIGFLLTLCVCSVFGLLGGLLGALFFRKNVPPPPPSPSAVAAASSARRLRRSSLPPPRSDRPVIRGRAIDAAPAIDRRYRQIRSDACRRSRRLPCRDRRSAAGGSLLRAVGRVPRQAHVYDRDLRRADAIPRRSGKASPAELEWSRPWARVLDWNPPHAKWFVGGTLNVSVNCLDRHVRAWRRNKAAFIWEGEPGDRRTLTYFDLYRQVCQFANVLKSLGVAKGDRVAIYMPLIPELADRHAGLRAHRRRPLAWSSAASAPSRCAIASTTRRRGCWSPPTAATAAATSSRSSRWPTRR